MLERLNEELRRRTRVVRIFPNAATCLRLTRALCSTRLFRHVPREIQIEVLPRVRGGPSP